MHNWKLKLLSLVSAILLWLVVVGINDPVRTFTFSGIHVDVVNSSAITSEGKVYEVLDDSDVITIQVKARRSAALSDTDFKAVANMQDIQLMKYVPINISCTKNVNIQSITTKTPNLKISIEDSDTKTLPIVVRTNGTPGAGYIIDKQYHCVAGERAHHRRSQRDPQDQQGICRGGCVRHHQGHREDYFPVTVQR